MDESRKALIEYRLEAAGESLAEARLLIENGRFRGAVNRTYYAAFYAASALTLTKGREFSKHSAVISFFDKEFVRTGVIPTECSKILHRAFNERQEDDYLPFVQFDRTEVQVLLDDVNGFVETVGRVLSSVISL